MFRFTKYCFLILFALFFSLSLSARDNFVSVTGGGTYCSPNLLSGSFDERVTEFCITAKGNRNVKGTVLLSSRLAAPVDPVNSIDFEYFIKVDAVRVFKDYPDIVWVHGIASGTITFGTNPLVGPDAGKKINLTPTTGEVIGAVSKWGRTSFLTVYRNGGNPLPDFATATEEDLITLVKGFGYILLTDGAKPGLVEIKTSGNSFIISK